MYNPWNKIQDEFSHLPLWKRKRERRRKRGTCYLCARPLSTKRLCEKHAADDSRTALRRYYDLKVETITREQEFICRGYDPDKARHLAKRAVDWQKSRIKARGEISDRQLEAGLDRLFEQRRSDD